MRRSGKRTRAKWIRAGYVALAIVVIGAVGFAAHAYRRSLARDESESAMRQVFAALQQYAEASAGNYYPMRSAQPGVFLPDMDEWAKLGNGKAEFEEAYEVLTADDDRPFCYLGYAFVNEALGHQLLDQLGKGPQALRGGGSSLEEEPWITDSHSPEVDDPHPLRKGVERCFVWDWVFHGNPPRDDQLAAPIPILWQMPRKEGDVVPVLRLNGYVEFHRYPGEFPMSPLFINRLRGVMGLPQDPGFTTDTPIFPLVREILETGSREAGLGVGSLLHFDTKPSVSVGNARGYRIELMGAEMVLFPEDADTTLVSADNLFEPPEGERYGLPYWSAIRYMGEARGYQWYGAMAYDDFLLLQREFELTGGDSLYSAAVSYWIDEEPNWVWLMDDPGHQRKPAEICRTPSSLARYVHAYITIRESKRRPVLDEVIHATAVLCGSEREGYGVYAFPTPEIVSEAKDRLVAAAEKDPEAAATLALPYVLRYRVRGPRSKATPDKVELLRRLPRDTLVPIIRHLAINLQDREEAALCKDLLLQLRQASADQ
ncbi:MAG: hypothetical protein GY851_24345 [bacterium]|nr:hypothetical protein [bacterium]